MRKLKEFIAEHLIDTEIFEMAQSLAEYREDINNIFPILVCHILLIMKANEEHSTEFVNHWKKEIRSFLRELCRKKLKIKDNYQIRYKHIYDIIIRKNEIDTDDDFIWDISHKLFEEGYDLEDEKIYNDFIKILHIFQDKYLNELIDIIASKKINKIQEFTDKL